MAILSLPYPPSVNHYWCRGRNGQYLSKRAKKFHADVKATVEEMRRLELIEAKPLVGLLTVIVDVFPPDHRKRDLDNALKAILDSLQKANVYKDDNQIQSITITRKECDQEHKGKVLVFCHNFAEDVEGIGA